MLTITIGDTWWLFLVRQIAESGTNVGSPPPRGWDHYFTPLLKTLATVRVQYCRKHKEPAKVTGSFIRFGTDASGKVQEAPLAGAIFAGVGIHDGSVYDAVRIVDGKPISVPCHPDTGENLGFTLPNWKTVIDKLNEIVRYVPQLRYMGFDVVITDNGFKILEVNSLTGLTALSTYYPFLSNPYGRDFFRQLFLERPKYFRRVLKTLDRTSHDTSADDTVTANMKVM